MRKWHDVKQNTDEWFDLRLGKMTSSNFGAICANMGKAFGDTAKHYARKKALEVVTGKLDDTASYSNKFMERGHELEPVAASLYEERTFNHVSNGGFYELGRYGDSPDGLVGEKGCIEIKCTIPKVHWLRWEKKNYDLTYKWQIQGHLFVSGREWCDFISYCPEFCEGKTLFVKRVFRDEEMISQLTERLVQFTKLVDKKVTLLRA